MLVHHREIRNTEKHKEEKPDSPEIKSHSKAVAELGLAPGGLVPMPEDQNQDALSPDDPVGAPSPPMGLEALHPLSVAPGKGQKLETPSTRSFGAVVGLEHSVFPAPRLCWFLHQPPNIC